jgi:hypothetical protein
LTPVRDDRTWPSARLDAQRPVIALRRLGDCE